MLLTIIREEKLALKSMQQQQKAQSMSEAPQLQHQQSPSHDIMPGGGNGRHEAYSVSFEVFHTLFTELTPWRKCVGVDIAEKLFRVSH